MTILYYSNVFITVMSFFIANRNSSRQMLLNYFFDSAGCSMIFIHPFILPLIILKGWSKKLYFFQLIDFHHSWLKPIIIHHTLPKKTWYYVQCKKMNTETGSKSEWHNEDEQRKIVENKKFKKLFSIPLYELNVNTFSFSWLLKCNLNFFKCY